MKLFLNMIVVILGFLMPFDMRLIIINTLPKQLKTKILKTP
jgi:hypothetical protein